MPRIALIDSGVAARSPGASSLVGSFALQREGGTIRRRPAVGDDIGHGTACAGLLRQAVPDLQLVSVRVFDRQLRADVALLVAAIEWARDCGASVINMSLGVTSSQGCADLRTACDAAAAAGVIVVAAEHNDGLVSYPAHFRSVIGVRGGKVYGEGAYDYRPDQPIECIARGDAQRVYWRGGRQVLMGGSSFAAPRIAGVVAQLKARHPDAGLEEIRALLRRHAAHVIDGPPPRAPAARGSNRQTPCRHPWVRRAALYPYTKEMHAFVRFRDLLPFEVVGVADPPGRGQVGQDAGEALGLPAAGLPIRSRVAEAARDADTLILGYLRQLGSLRGRDLHRELLGVALDRGFHVFSFEPLPLDLYGDLHEAARERGLHLDWPAVTRAAADEILRGPPAGGAVDRPVLGVFGTSASQGKFTLQLALRRRLSQLGYRVGQLGTEHHAELFGMDWALPMGHGSTVEVDVADYPDLLDRKMREICWCRRPDLILVGSQSGTIPFDLNDHRTLSLPTLAFLLGTKPDACALVVNAIDPEDYVADTLSALEALAQARVIALALSDRAKEVGVRHGRPWTRHRRAGADELEGDLRRLEDRFGRPAVGIASDAGIERLCAAIVATFAAPGAQRPGDGACQGPRT